MKMKGLSRMRHQRLPGRAHRYRPLPVTRSADSVRRHARHRRHRRHLMSVAAAAGCAAQRRIQSGIRRCARDAEPAGRALSGQHPASQQASARTETTAQHHTAPETESIDIEPNVAQTTPKTHVPCPGAPTGIQLNSVTPWYILSIDASKRSQGGLCNGTARAS